MHPQKKKKSDTQTASSTQIKITSNLHVALFQKVKKKKKKKEMLQNRKSRDWISREKRVQGTSSNAAVIASRHFQHTGRITARFSISSLSLRGLPLRGPRAYRTIPSPVASPPAAAFINVTRFIN